MWKRSKLKEKGKECTLFPFNLGSFHFYFGSLFCSNSIKPRLASFAALCLIEKNKMGTQKTQIEMKRESCVCFI